jgi:predicted ribosomally synthesized peptide with SipW-like signal peptide
LVLSQFQKGGEIYMKKILFSIAMIAVVGGTAVGVTYAFFTSTQEVQGNTVSTGTLNFTGVIEDTNDSSSGDSGKLSSSSLAPGQSFKRCLWVRNAGTISGRYKIYRLAEDGDFNMGNLITISAKLNPTSGGCEDNSNPFTGATLYGPNDLAKAEWQNVGVRGAFASASTTPFKILATEQVMPANHYSLFELTVKLDPSATQQGVSYTFNSALFGTQDEASNNASTW